MLIDEAKIAGQLSHANIAQIFDLGQRRRPLLHRPGVRRRPRPARHPARTWATRPGASPSPSPATSCSRCARASTTRTTSATRPAIRSTWSTATSARRTSSRRYEGEIKLIDFGIVKAEGRADPHPGRPGQGQVRVHVAGAAARAAGRPALRRVRLRHRAARAPDRPSAVQAGDRVRDPAARALRRDRTAEQAQPARCRRELDRIALKALARHVNDRYQSALQFRDELWEFVRSHGCFYTRNELAAWMRQTFPEGSARGRPRARRRGGGRGTAGTAAAGGRPARGRLRAAAVRTAAERVAASLDYDQSDPDSELPQDPDSLRRHADAGRAGLFVPLRRRRWLTARGRPGGAAIDQADGVDRAGGPRPGGRRPQPARPGRLHPRRRGRSAGGRLGPARSTSASSCRAAARPKTTRPPASGRR